MMNSNFNHITNKKVVRNEYEFMKAELAKLTALVIKQEKQNFEIAREKEFMQDKFFELMKKENKRKFDDQLMFEELMSIMELVESYELALENTKPEPQSKSPEPRYKEEMAILQKSLVNCKSEAKAAREKAEAHALVQESAFNTRVTVLNSEKEKFYLENVGLKAQLTNSEHTIEELRQELMQNRRKTSGSIDYPVETETDSIPNEQLQALESQVEELRALIKSRNEEIENLQIKSNNFLSNTLQLNEEIRLKNDEIEKLTRDLSTGQDRLKTADTLTEELSLINEDLKRENGNLHEQLDKSIEKFDTMKTKAYDFQAKLSEKEIFIDKIASSNSILELQIHSTKRENEHLKRRIYNLETKLRILEEDEEISDSEEVGIRGELKGLKRNQLIDRSMKYYFENEELVDELARLDVEVKEFRSKDFESQLIALTSQLDEISKEHSQDKELISTLESQIQETKDSLKESRNQNSELYLQKRKLNGLVEEKNNEIIEHQKTIEELKKQTSSPVISFQNFSINTSEQTTSKLEENSKIDKVRITQLERQLETQTQEVVGLKAMEKSLDKSLQETLNQKIELVQEIANLQDEHQAIKSQLERIQTIRNTEKNHDATKQDLSERFRELDEANISLRIEKSTATDTIRSQRKEISILKRKIDEMESKIQGFIMNEINKSQYSSGGGKSRSYNSKTSNDLKESTKEWENEIRRLEEANLELRERLIRYERQILDSNSQRKGILEENERLKADLKEYKSQGPNSISYSSIMSKRKRMTGRERSSSDDEKEVKQRRSTVSKVENSGGKRDSDELYGSKFIRIMTSKSTIKSDVDSIYKTSPLGNRSKYSVFQD